jgi:hypothetical protein
MTDPLTDRPVHVRRAMRRTLRENSGPSAHAVIGSAHVALGALGICDALLQTLFEANAIALIPFIAIAVGGELR